MKPGVDRSARPLLFDTLSVLLPTVEQTWLLRACLHTGAAGCEAWQVWLGKAGDPKRALAEERQGVKWLLPLLYHALQSNGMTVNRDLMPYLRTAYFREELRSRTYRQVCHEVLVTLATAGIPLIVLDGAALADAIYVDWTLRHSGTLDVLVQQTDLPRAETALRAAGLLPSARGLDTVARAISIEHESGLPIIVHSALFPLPYYQAPMADIWGRSLGRQIAAECHLRDGGVPLRILAPADMLLHVCGQASCSRSRDTLQWVCDSWYILQKCADLDWDLLLDGTLRSHLALPLSVMLGYLAEEIEAPIPGPVLDQLTNSSARATVVAREAALTGARAGTQGTFGRLLRQTDSWLGKAMVLKWKLLPSPSCLRWTYAATRSPWLLPAYYLVRPLRYLSRRIGAAFRRAAPC